jgi:hypothetical protein
MKDTQDIAGLRFQKYDNGAVHIHDDSKNLKFVMNSKNFKRFVKEFLKMKGDATTILNGTSKERLLLVKEDKNIFAVVMPEQDILKDLNTFLGTL